jgi:hypothetical protein
VLYSRCARNRLLKPSSPSVCRLAWGRQTESGFGSAEGGLLHDQKVPLTVSGVFVVGAAEGRLPQLKAVVPRGRSRMLAVILLHVVAASSWKYFPALTAFKVLRTAI